MFDNAKDGDDNQCLGGLKVSTSMQDYHSKLALILSRQRSSFATLNKFQAGDIKVPKFVSLLLGNPSLDLS